MADHIASQLTLGGAEVRIFHARNGFCPRFIPKHRIYDSSKLGSRIGFMLEIGLRKFSWAHYILTDFGPLLWALSLRNHSRLIFLAQGIDSALYENKLVSGIVHGLIGRTLKRNSIPVLCSGPTCAHLLRRDFKANVTLIQEGEWSRLIAFAKAHHSVIPAARHRRYVLLSIVSKPWAKGPDVCFQGLNNLSRELAKDLEVWLVGDDLGWNLPNLAVQHFGRVSSAQLAKLYAGADVFLFTSRSENFPSPPFEAMSQGCPVISTLTAHYMRPDKEFLQVSINSPKDIANGVQRILEDVTLRHKLVQEGHLTVNNACTRFGGKNTVIEDFLECVYSNQYEHAAGTGSV